MEDGAHLLVTGAGSVAAATLQALGVMQGPPLRIAIAARDSDRLRWLARSVAARASAVGRPLQVEACPLDWDDPSSLRAVLARARPRVVFHAGTWQSPSALEGADPWSELVRQVGYGITMPLHLAAAERVALALAEVAPEAQFVTAGYPDAVNPMLAGAGLPITCGIGNVAILAAHAAAEVRFEAPLRMIAHYAHLEGALSGKLPPTPIRAWAGEAAVDAEVNAWLATARLPDDARLNEITGATAAALLLALVDPGTSHRGHAPGVGGRPGGYPVRVRDGVVSLDLPSGLSEDDAVEHNLRAARADAVVVDREGRGRWAEATLERLEGTVRLSRTFSSADIGTLAQTILELRATLLGGRSKG